MIHFNVTYSPFSTITQNMSFIILIYFLTKHSKQTRECGRVNPSHSLSVGINTLDINVQNITADDIKILIKKKRNVT